MEPQRLSDERLEENKRIIEEAPGLTEPTKNLVRSLHSHIAWLTERIRELEEKHDAK